MQNFLQNNKFFVSVVTLCNIFSQDLNDYLAFMFFYKIDFSLKNKLRAFFRCFFVCFFYQPIACSVFPGKNMAFLTFIFFKYEKLIF